MLKTSDFMESSRERLDHQYMVAGNRTYMVGTQNGAFPDFGHHVAHEMGGLWDHPIKLMDGFWLQVVPEGRSEDEAVWLNEAVEFRNYPYYNEHHYALDGLGLGAVRRQFCPDDTEGFVIAYEFVNHGNEEAKFDLRFLGRTDLSPVWFSNEIGIFDGVDDAVVDETRGAIVGHDQDHPWFVVFGGDRKFSRARVERELFGPERTAGNGVTGDLVYEGLAVKPGESVTVRFFIAGSYTSREAALDTYELLKRDHAAMLEKKRQRYDDMLSRTVIDIPDKHLQNVFNWVKFNNDWLVRNVPEVGNGLGAGHPEYPWWFGTDNSYSLLGVLPLGEFGLVNDTLHLLARESEKANGNGRIVHEISTNGAVANIGNTQETPHFIKCVWHKFLWTGDVEFLRGLYPLVKQGIDWLLDEQDQDGDLLPEGYGITEIEGLNLELIDTAVYTCEALEVASRMAELFGEADEAKRYYDTHLKLKDKINRDLWLEEEGLYADAMGAPGAILERIDTYIERARNSGAIESGIEELEQMKLEMQSLDPNAEKPWLFKNWVINTPMEAGIASREQAVRALDRMATGEFTGEYGTYLSGSYQTAMMTISTGVQAVAESRYDRMDESLRFVRLIASTFNMRLPGSISEMSPDYGCFVQAWTAYGIVYPLMSHMLGIQPRSYWKQLTLRPRLPREWLEASVKRVVLGSGESANELDWEIQLGEREDVYRLSLRDSGWDVEVNVPAGEHDEVLVDGELVKGQSIDGARVISLSNAMKHEIVVRKG